MIGKENLFGRLWHRIGCMYLMGLHYTPTEVPFSAVSKIFSEEQSLAVWRDESMDLVGVFPDTFGPEEVKKYLPERLGNGKRRGLFGFCGISG